MRAWWLAPAIAAAALASVLTAAEAQESNRSQQTPTQSPPEALQPRSVQTQSFRRQVEPDTLQPAQIQAVGERSDPLLRTTTRKRNRSVTTGQATRQVSREATARASRTARASSVRRSSRALPQYAQARTVERAAVVREVIVSPTELQRADLRSGFDQYIVRMNIWTRPPWEIPATVGATVPGGIQVYGVPAEIVAIYPAFAGAQFVVVGDDVVILEPGSRRIVAMLSRTSGAYVAERAGPPSTTGVALAEDRVRLSRAETAAIRTVLRQRECRYRQRSDFFVGDVVPGAAPLCEFPERVIAAVPDIEGYRFITRRNAVVVVDPARDRVVSVIR
jgi:hypothetical protein